MNIVDQIMAMCSQQNVMLSLNGEQLEVAFDDMPGQELIVLLRDNKPEICRFLRLQTNEKLQDSRILKLQTKTGPLSPTQQRMWFASQYAPESTQNNICCQLALTGELDVMLFEQTLQHIVRRHEVLRTGYDAKEPFQFVRDEDLIRLQFVDLRGGVEIDLLSKAGDLLQAELNQPFDLQQDLMIRAMLVRTHETRYSLGIVLHHIAADGWSLQVLSDEVVRIYTQLKTSSAERIDTLPVQYLDYAYWTHERRDLQDNQLQYWLEQLRDAPQVHRLPLDYPRPQYQQYDAKQLSVRIDTAMSTQLNALCKSMEVTPFMFLYTAFGYLISRWSNQNDVVIGTPVAGRSRPELEGLIGCFVNTLILRNQFDESDFSSLLAKTKEHLIAAYQYQNTPFDVLVEQINPQRSSQILPLVQIFFTFHNQQTDAVFNLPDCSMQFVQQIQAATKADLELSVVERQGQYVFEWNYATSLFSADTMNRLSTSFMQLLQFVIHNPEGQLSELSLLPPKDVANLACWQNGEEAPTMATLLPDLLAEVAHQHAEKPAFICNGRSSSYGQLQLQVSQLAHYLRDQHGIGPESRVGICFAPSVSMMVAVLAVLQAGGAYVPLDPKLPVSRLHFMYQDSSASLILTDRRSGMATLLPDILNLDDVKLQEQLACYAPEPLTSTETGLCPQHLAYIIYTSGSTGQPKGVMVEHRQLNHYLQHCLQNYYRQQSASVLSTSLAFDASVTAFLPQLLLGLPCYIMPANELTVELATHIIEAKSAQVYKLTPAHLVALAVQLADHRPAFTSALAHCFVVGGERLLNEHCYQFMQHFTAATLINEYGPTETTVGCSISKWCSKEGAGVQGVSIGRPVQNTVLLVLDKALRPLPVGAVGELYIGGAGLARGYTDSSLTADRFIQYPDQPDVRLYRTGDLVSWQADGRLEYIGRNDFQLKIRGYRVEAGEIEQALTDIDSVRDAAVVALEGVDGQKLLVAYVITDPASSETASQLRSRLQEQLLLRLPDYMVPEIFVSLHQFPVTNNGKVDRQALPAPDFNAQKNSYQQPVSREAVILAGIWCEVLGVSQVGLDDNFFALGGHSILALQVAAKLLEQGIELNPRDIFAHATLGELASVIHVVDDPLHVAGKTHQDALSAGLTRITPELLPLATLTQDEIDHIVEAVPGGILNIKDIYALGPLQEGILFHHIASTDVDPYVRPITFRLDNSSALHSFIEGIKFVISRHDVLRTRLAWKGLQQQVQVVLHKVELPISTRQLDSQEEVDLYLQQFLQRPHRMDLQRAPLIELEVLSLPDAQHCYVLLRFHHIISDHIGMEILSEELAQFQAGQTAQLPAPVPYRDFIAHVQARQRKLDAQSYFKAKLGDLDAGTLLFGLDEIYGDGQSLASASAWLPDAQCQQIRRFSRQLQISPAVLFHAAWALVVSACSGSRDVVFGTVVSGRMQGISDVGRMMGVFINTVPLRLSLVDLSVTELIQQVKTELGILVEYEQTPLSLALRCSGVQGPLFNSLLNYRHSRQTTPQQQTGSYTTLNYQERTNYPVELLVDDFGDRFAFEVQVTNQIDAQDLLGYVSTALQSLLGLLAEDVTSLVTSINLLSVQQRHQQLTEWNATTRPWSEQSCIHQLFEAVATQQPTAIAAEFDGRVLSYQELNEQANQFAHLLRAKYGVTTDTVVGICMERSLEMVIAMLAIAKAGGAYLPLDPTYPAQRLRYMQQDSGLTLVLAHQVTQTINWSCMVLCLDGVDIPALLASCPRHNPALQDTELQAHNLAYVLYTSGSTGIPKGVMIEHRSLVNRIQWMQQQFDVTADDVILQKTPYSFDVSVWEFFLPLISGARLVLALPEGHKDPDYLAELINSAKVTTLHFVPAMFASMLQTGLLQHCPRIRQVFCSGEALSPSIVDSFSQQCPEATLYNLYGPTEATIDVTSWRCEAGQRIVPIGKPIDNTQVFVLNPWGSLLPRGCVGELYLGGVGLARGYLNQPVLTQEQFIVSPFKASQRIYRTGDLVRWRRDGVLEYLGRADQQVKINGVRIEPAEVDYALCQLPIIQTAVTVAKHLPHGQSLVSYLVLTESGTDIKEPQLTNMVRSQLAKMLPVSLIPSFFVVMDHLPLTNSGKVNRRELPDPARGQGTLLSRAPADALERLLCDIWQQVLVVNEAGVNDHFFALGGDSIRALQVVARLNRQYPDLTVRALFDCPTPAKLAGYIKSKWGLTDASGQMMFSAWQQILLDRQEQTRNIYHAVSGAWLPYDAEQIRHVFSRLLDKYDTCRLQLDFKGGRSMLSFTASSCDTDGSWFRLVEVDKEQDSSSGEINSVVAQAIDSFKSATAQFGVVLFSEKALGSRLLIQADALTWDLASWSRLLDEVATIFSEPELQAGREEGVVQYTDWMSRQLQYEEARQHETEQFWQEKLAALPVIVAQKSTELLISSRQEWWLGTKLDAETWQQVQTELKLSAEEFWLLLSARTFYQMQNQVPTLINVVCDGRADPVGAAAVLPFGNLTKVVPVFLPQNIVDDFDSWLALIKDQFRQSYRFSQVTAVKATASLTEQATKLVQNSGQWVITVRSSTISEIPDFFSHVGEDRADMKLNGMAVDLDFSLQPAGIRLVMHAQVPACMQAQFSLFRTMLEHELNVGCEFAMQSMTYKKLRQQHSDLLVTDQAMLDQYGIDID